MRGAKRNGLLFWLSLLALCLAMGGTALADSKKASESYTLDNITVTAQKQEEDLQKVPVSMDAFTEEQLEIRGVYNVDEMTRFAPNVHFQRNSYENNLVIRGVAPMGNTMSSPAGVYIDDVPLPFNYMFNWDLYDLERVEVLRGPQGTIYGRNTESGLIKIITKQPGNELRAKAYGDLGFYDTSHGSVPSYKVGGSVSGPLLENKLYLGFAGRVEYSDGFMKNLYNNDDEIGRIDRMNGRGTLRWTPREEWDVAFIADFLSTDDGDGFYRFSSGPYKTDRNEVNYDYTNSRIKQNSNGQNLRIKYKGNSFDAVSVSGRRHWHADTAGEYDLSPDPYGFSDADYKSTLINQEFRFSSPAKNKGPWKWLVGAYLANEADEISMYNSTSGTTATDITIQSVALFGQATYTLLQRLHLTAGLRLEKVDQSGDQSLTDLSGGVSSWNKDLDSQEALPRVAVSYDVTRDVMAYASASKGYLSGGYRFWSNSVPQQFAYDPEYTWNYEAGLKTSFWEKRLTLNLSVFYIDMQDKQVLEYSPELGNSKLRNAAEAHSQGFELEANAKLLRGLEVIAGFGYTETKIDDWLATEMDYNTGQVVKTDYSGKDLPDVPKYTYNLGLQYRHTSGCMARVDLLGVGEFYNDATNLVKNDAYNVVNLRLGYESTEFDVMLWSKNLFDEEYYTKQYDWGGAYMGYEAAPRMVGVTFTWRY